MAAGASTKGSLRHVSNHPRIKEMPMTETSQPLVLPSRRAMVAATFAGALMSESAFAKPAAASRPSGHGAVILVDSDDTKIMGHAISYSMNLTRAYAESNEHIRIEVVANGSGITIFRADESPFQSPLAEVLRAVPGIVFSMCNSSRQIAEQKEGKAITLIPGARLVPFGIRRVIELQEARWSYIHG
jgi:intracellular sulfur oxidation DsrE/DsrF family protein